jgi:hypothetical protein
MTPVSNKNFVVAAASLARAAPSQWDQFVRAMSEHYESTKEQFVSSPSSSIQLAQGRAQEARDILNLCRDCKSEADQIENRIKTNAQPIRAFT